MAESLLQDWGDPQPSALAVLAAERRRAGHTVTDLVTANPQEHGFEFPQDLLAAILAESATAARTYAPDPRGRVGAREAVAAWHGDRVAADRVLLTPGTSFAYWMAFRLLCDGGGEVLCPTPTYPLFDDLARLAGAAVRRYHLRESGARWALDPDEVEFQVTPRTRAVVVVSPHNPTGTVAGAGELAALAAIARRHNLAIVFDEVFRDFTHTADRVPRPSEFDAPLTLTLNGFSKMLSLPGLKAAWVVAEGDPPAADRFLHAAEYVSDTFLPLSEITQAAIPLLLERAAAIPPRFAALYTRRMAELVASWRAAGLPATMPEAGPYLCIPLPSPAGALAEQALRDQGILVHPGSLYGLDDHRLVMTCVAAPPWPVRELAALAAAPASRP